MYLYCYDIMIIKKISCRLPIFRVIISMVTENGFLLGLVFGQNRPLCEYSVVSGNHIEIALRVIKFMSRNNRNAFSDHGDYVYTLKFNDQGYIFVCLATRDVDLQSQNVFLDKLEELWMSKIAPNLDDFSPYSQNSTFGPDISALIADSNIDYLTQLSPRPIDRKMTNIHTSLVYSDNLNITPKKDKTNVTKKRLFFKRWKNRILYNRTYMFVAFSIMIISLIGLYMLLSYIL